MKTPKLWFDDEHVFITTEDGRTGSLALREFPRLYNATREQRENYHFSPSGVHWPDIDEDLCLAGFNYDDKAGEAPADNIVAAVFRKLPEINVSRFARYMGINESLLAKYICGAKRPSAQRLREIEEALHRFGKELSAISL
jgi:hypothetical protein